MSPRLFPREPNPTFPADCSRAVVRKETQPDCTSRKGLKPWVSQGALYGGQFILKKVGCTRKMGGTASIDVARKPQEAEAY